MAPSLPCSSLKLDYPLYALDFDPEDAARLLVGGGGGASRSGVGNKITVLEARQDELRVAAEAELSRDEDSVMSLAVGPGQGRSKPTRLFAGINSDLVKSVNMHLRTFAIHHGSSGKVAELSRTALFANPDANTYQRLLRVAGPVGAAASAMGKESQIAVFETTGSRPKPRGLLELPVDAEDLDVIQTADNECLLAFCYKYELHVVAVKAKQNSEPRLVYTVPVPQDGRRPAIRAIRFLTPDFLLAVSNLPQRRGVLIQGLRMPAAESDTMASVAVVARISRNVSATALAVANPSPTTSPSWTPLGDAQFVVAVAGNDSSIFLYTLEHRAASSLNLLFDLLPVCTLADAHDVGAITGLAFSRPTTATTTATGRTKKLQLFLASISFQMMVAVHSVPLREHFDGDQPRRNRGPPRKGRHVVALRARRPSSKPLILALSLMVLVMALVGQGVMELYGRSEPLLFGGRFAPSSWHGALAPSSSSSSSSSSSPFPPSSSKQVPLNDLLSRTRAKNMILVGDSAAIRADVHDATVHGPAKAWDELGAEQKRIWRQRLVEAGAWTQGMGESVFRGVLFGQIAGAIGRAVQG
ncbi:hypothetical protein CP533_3829 [Ophiocordyceps camponoti-saundersi (nom. inval.)]|nr:hypothetical protein CP533_3829 [Ophiocordyceps camponoti-saundersi (nom. inval.)]